MIYIIMCDIYRCNVLSRISMKLTTAICMKRLHINHICLCMYVYRYIYMYICILNIIMYINDIYLKHSYVLLIDLRRQYA